MYVSEIWKLSECDINRLDNFQFGMYQKSVTSITNL